MKYLLAVMAALVLALPATAAVNINQDWSLAEDVVRISSFNDEAGYSATIDLGSAGFGCVTSGVAAGAVTAEALSDNTIGVDWTGVSASSSVASGGVTNATWIADRYVRIKWTGTAAAGNFIEIVCTRGASGVAFSDGATSETDLGGAVSELYAIKLDAADATEVLLQGENGVADTSDPNDSTASPDVTCSSAIPGKCLFFSDEGIGFVNESTTLWRPISPNVYEFYAEAVAHQDDGSMDGTQCYYNPIYNNTSDRPVACGISAGAGDYSFTRFFPKGPAVLGRVCVTTVATSVPGNATVGCGICATMDDGLTCLGGLQASAPSADGINNAVGNQGCAVYNEPLDAGEYFGLYGVTGNFSGSGGEGTCTGGQVILQVEVEVYDR